MISFQCGEERNDPILENVSVSKFRSVWKFQKMKPEIESNFTCENIRPEVLANLNHFQKYSVMLTLDFVFGRLFTSNLAVLQVELD